MFKGIFILYGNAHTRPLSLFECMYECECDFLSLKFYEYASHRIKRNENAHKLYKVPGESLGGLVRF